MYDKSKKTWSQRLKISSDNSSSNSASLATVGGMQTLQMQQLQQALHLQQQQQQQHHQQQLHHHHQQQHQHHAHHLQHLAYQLPPPPAAPPPGYEFLPSALSRSMKYAEPWIYGTVRGIPARPSYGYGHHPHAAAIFATDGGGEPATATALAVVICSCAEYLNGTKRDVKKASVCKKCKGSRLPLATISGGGTVRLPAAAAQARRPTMAATMRVVSTSKKSRPTILDPQKDPYDLMRRTRLLSPEPSVESSSASCSKDGKSRSRENATATAATAAAAAATSMQRGRTRTRAALPSSTRVSCKTTPTSPVAPPDPADCWLMEDNESLLLSSGLVASSKSSNSSGSSNRRSILRCNVNPYDLISVESGKKKNLPHHDDFDVADAQLHEDEQEQRPQQQQPLQPRNRKFHTNNVTAIAGQRISLGDKQNDSPDSSDSYERIIIATVASEKKKTTQPQSPAPAATATAISNPKRPPRNKKVEEPLSLETPTATTVVAAAVVAAATETADCNANDDASYTVLTVSPTPPGIKSILKRPTTLELPASALPACILTPADSSPAVASTMTTMTTSAATTPSGKSQFYIPTPTTATPTPTSASARKKVQFMVEDKIIAMTTTATATATTADAAAATAATATTDDSENNVLLVVGGSTDETTMPAAAAANYEYYNRKRNAAAAAAQQETAQQQRQQPTLSALGSDVDDEQNFTASAEPTTTQTTTTGTTSLATHITPDSLHYEDVLPSPVHQIFDNSCSNSNSSNSPAVTAGQVNEISSSSKLLLSSSTMSHAGSTAATAAGASTAEVTAATATAAATALPHVSANVVNALTAGTTAATATETEAEGAAAATQKTTAANRDYDDDDEHNDSSKQQTEVADKKETKELKQLEDKAESEAETKTKTETKTESELVPRASEKRAAQTTQSRNPIRRAHSERHLSGAPNKNSAVSVPPAQQNGQQNGSQSQSNSRSSSESPTQSQGSGPQNVILNFKDTMALRIKSNRNDSRDLFQRRPTEPPPPPPPPKTAMTTLATPTANGLAEQQQQQQQPQQINKSTAAPRQQAQRTVVRVAPFNKQSNEVHRLKISHSEQLEGEQQQQQLLHSSSDHNVVLRQHSPRLQHATATAATDVAPKKTSILINGDDCYSTMNLSADAAQPLYQSSVVVNSQVANSVCINVSSVEHEHNLLNTLRSQQQQQQQQLGAIIPIRSSIGNNSEINLQRSASCISSTSSSSTSSSSSSSGRGRTLIRLDYEKEKKEAKATSTTPINTTPPAISSMPATPPPATTTPTAASTPLPTSSSATLVPHETELLKILRNPVEAVKRNLVPHVCGLRVSSSSKKQPESSETTPTNNNSSFIAKLLQDPMLGQVADGLETDTVAELIENSLQRLQQSRQAIDMSGTKDHDDMNRLISVSLQRVRLERQPIVATAAAAATKEEDRLSNRGSISSANSFASAHNYELFDFEAAANESDCYQSCSSELTAAGVLEEEPAEQPDVDATTRAKFYQLLVDATLAEIEHATHAEAEHHYESIRMNGDPIYEEINEVPPPLPLTAPPLNDAELEKKAARSIFEGASKYDILSYLVDAKERGLAREESFDYSNNPKIIEEEATDTLSELEKRVSSSDDSHSNMSSLSPPPHTFICGKSGSDVERQDSGVGSETSKSSRSKYQPAVSPLHLCEDCDGAVETQLSEAGVLYAPLVCRKCGKKRVERKEIITEIVETEEKYGRDLQIILEEFCHPMLVAGLLTQEQLSAIFLNTEDLLENNQTLAERMRDALDIALEQGDDDLLTVNIGRIFLDFTQMLHAFESYCVRQAGASLLLANLEKEKELLRIFLKVSQMENAVLRRMNLNSFLMVPVQRVTKYPLLLARLYKVTPSHLDGRELLKQAQEKIELHLNHINQEAKDVPTKLWRRISSSSPNRRASCEIDMINIKLRKMAIDILEWNHDEVRFAMEGKLLYTQPTDSNWKKARTIKLTPVNALLVTNGKPSANYRAEKAMSDKLNFPKHTGIREASLLLVKEKCGRYTLIREPLYLDRCVVCSEADWDDYFEVQEISSKDTFIFKAEDGVRTKQWYTQLQYHAQGMGAWRKRRNALANIMINGMLARS
ncbi:mucin-2 [Drosophila nasuta]|uniref:mucin-2 n=1 Tax=Drosophila nasuta TaxID=42062 RepID=UPI00295EE102|nr:mucin-2 [Drosophila nasuta]